MDYVEKGNSGIYSKSLTSAVLGGVSDATACIYVKILNASTGGLNIQGVNILSAATESDTDGISTITAAGSSAAADGATYDVLGRRVAMPISGQVYIKDGKKYVQE